jgi:hypothetical protein
MLLCCFNELHNIHVYKTFIGLENGYCNTVKCATNYFDHSETVLSLVMNFSSQLNNSEQL